MESPGKLTKNTKAEFDHQRFCLNWYEVWSGRGNFTSSPGDSNMQQSVRTSGQGKHVKFIL